MAEKITSWDFRTCKLNSFWTEGTSLPLQPDPVPCALLPVCWGSQYKDAMQLSLQVDVCSLEFPWPSLSASRWLKMVVFCKLRVWACRHHIGSQASFWSILLLLWIFLIDLSDIHGKRSLPEFSESLSAVTHWGRVPHSWSMLGSSSLWSYIVWPLGAHKCPRVHFEIMVPSFMER